MARKPRIHFPGALYHCINRGNQRNSLYLSDEDYLSMLDAMAEVVIKYGALIHAFTLMPNHWHALIQVQEVPLHTIMRSCLTKYARYFNRTHHKTGHVFEKRYRAILCQKEAYLLELVRYVHLNPLRAHLVDEPQQWRWSSLHLYLHPAQHAWLYTSDILELFGKHPRQRLADFLAQVTPLDPARIYPSESFPILGDDAFIKAATEAVSLRRYVACRWPGPRVSLPDLANYLAQQLTLSPLLLALRHRGPQCLAQLRATIVYAAIQYFSYQNSQLASFLNVSSAAVSILYQKFLAQIFSDPSVEAKLFQSLKQRFLTI
jgi:putative transposase